MDFEKARRLLAKEQASHDAWVQAMNEQRAENLTLLRQLGVMMNQRNAGHTSAADDHNREMAEIRKAIAENTKGIKELRATVKDMLRSRNGGRHRN